MGLESMGVRNSFTTYPVKEVVRTSELLMLHVIYRIMDDNASATINKADVLEFYANGIKDRLGFAMYDFSYFGSSTIQSKGLEKDLRALQEADFISVDNNGSITLQEAGIYKIKNSILSSNMEEGLDRLSREGLMKRLKH